MDSDGRARQETISVGTIPIYWWANSMECDLWPNGQVEYSNVHSWLWEDGKWQWSVLWVAWYMDRLTPRRDGRWSLMWILLVAQISLDWFVGVVETDSQKEL